MTYHFVAHLWMGGLANANLNIIQFLAEFINPLYSQKVFSVEDLRSELNDFSKHSLVKYNKQIDQYICYYNTDIFYYEGLMRKPKLFGIYPNNWSFFHEVDRNPDFKSLHEVQPIKLTISEINAKSQLVKDFVSKERTIFKDGNHNLNQL